MTRKGNTHPSRKAQSGHATNAANAKALASGKEYYDEEAGVLREESTNPRPSRAARRNEWKQANPIAKGVQEASKTKGRNLTRKAKEIKKIEVDYSHNTYYLEPGLTKPNGDPRCALKHSDRRSPAPARPKNIPPNAMERLNYLLVGRDRPFYKVSEKTIPEVLSPVFGYIERSMMMAAAIKCISVQDKMVMSVSYVGPFAYLSSIVEALRFVLTPDITYALIHYTNEKRPFHSIAPNVKYVPLYVDREAGTFGGAYADAAPKYMVSYMAGDIGTLANYVYKNFKQTTFIDFTCWSPTQRTGSIGKPIAEATWKQHIHSGLERIDLRTDHNTHHVMPSFLFRGIAVKTVLAIAAGSEKHTRMLFGIVVLDPASLSSAWFDWPSRNGALVDGDDGSTPIYQSEHYIKKFLKHNEKMEVDEARDRRTTHMQAVNTVMADVLREELERYDRAQQVLDEEGAGVCPTDEEDDDDHKDETTDSEEDRQSCGMRYNWEERRYEPDTGPRFPSIPKFPLPPSFPPPILDSGPSFPALPDRPVVEDGMAIEDNETGESFFNRMALEDDDGEWVCESSEVDSDGDPSEEHLVLSPCHRPKKDYPVQVAKLTTTHQKNTNGRMDPVLRIPPQSQGALPLVPAVAVRSGGSWSITRAFHSWYEKLIDFNNQPISRAVRISVVAGMGLIAFRFRSPFLLLTTFLTALTADFTDPDPALPCDDLKSIDLDPEQSAHLSMLVSATIRDGKARTPDNIARISATACRQWKDVQTTQVMGAVAREWTKQRAALVPGWKFPTMLAASALASFVITKVPLPRIPRSIGLGLLSRMPEEDAKMLRDATVQHGAKVFWAYIFAVTPPSIMEEFLKYYTASAISTTFGSDMSTSRLRVGIAFGLLEACTNPGRLIVRDGEPSWADSYQDRLTRTVPAMCMHALSAITPLNRSVFMHVFFNWSCVLDSFHSAGALKFLPYFAPYLSIPVFQGCGMLPYWLSSFVVTKWSELPMNNRPANLGPLNQKADIYKPNISFSTMIRPICTRHLPLPPLRDTTVVKKQRELAVECSGGQGYRCIGPYISTHIPFCYRSCEHNMRRAMHTRMGGVPKAFLSDDSAQRQKMVDDEIDRCFQDSFQTLRDTMTRPLVIETGTVEDWLARFPNNKANDMWNEWIKNPKIRTGYRCFIKKEKSVYDVETDSALWMDDDPLFNYDKFDPRGISVPYEELRVESGPWADGLNKAMHRSFTHQVYYNPGNRPRATSEWYDWALDQVRTGKLPWAMALQGDDSLLIYRHPITGIIMVLCADMSRYDLSQRTAHMMNVWRFLDFVGAKKCPTYEIQIDQQTWRVYHTPLGKFKVKGTMASGDSVTITFNTFTLALAFVSWLREGGDFVTFMASIGFTVTHTIVSPDAEPLLVDFLQCRPWLTQDSIRVFGPKPGRILSRFFWVDKTFSTETRYLMELKTMVIGLWPLASHVPIINDLLFNLIHLVRDIEPTRERFEGPEELKLWFEGSSEDEHPDTLNEMAMLYSVQLEDLEDLRVRCRSWNFDGPLDNTPNLSETVRRIARVDLQ